MPDPLKPPKPSLTRTGLNVLRLAAIAVFVPVWALQMNLSAFGPLTPVPSSGAIYPVTIHGGIIYATRWQSYFASQEALGVAIVLWALNILLRRGLMWPQGF
ncbi:MAG TPA: hypothetical protein VEC38_04435 [Candidatus Binataceae bacterium]|nr:hypothetical protein [Candidatus Binataceae bacterium]